MNIEAISRVLSRPERWRIVCSSIPVEEEPKSSAAYTEWLSQQQPHRHTHQELLFCLEGTTSERFKGVDYRCRPGTLFLIDSNEEHARDYPKEGNFTHLWVMGMDGKSSVANLYRQEYGIITSTRMPTLLSRNSLEWLDRRWAELKTPNPWMSNQLRRAALVSAILPLLLETIEALFTPKEELASPDHKRRIVEAVRLHMEANPGKVGGLDTLAHLSGYSKFHFARMFREFVGQAPHEYLNSLKVAKASKMIKEGIQRKRIADELGFSCPAAFSNWQRKNIHLQR